MGYADRLGNTLGIAWLSGRICAVQKTVGSKLAGGKKTDLARLNGPLLLGLSLLLGFWAWKTTARSALEEWEIRHEPPFVVWRHSILSYGYREASRNEALKKAATALASVAEQPGSAWTSPGTEWIILARGRDDYSAELAYFCRTCEAVTGRFESTGRGWLAFTQLLERIKRAPVLSDRKTKARAASAVDPRAIRY